MAEQGRPQAQSRCHPTPRCLQDAGETRGDRDLIRFSFFGVALARGSGLGVSGAVVLCVRHGITRDITAT